VVLDNQRIGPTVVRPSGYKPYSRPNGQIYHVSSRPIASRPNGK